MIHIVQILKSFHGIYGIFDTNSLSTYLWWQNQHRCIVGLKMRNLRKGRQGFLLILKYKRVPQISPPSLGLMYLLNYQTQLWFRDIAQFFHNPLPLQNLCQPFRQEPGLKLEHSNGLLFMLRVKQQKNSSARTHAHTLSDPHLVQMNSNICYLPLHWIACLIFHVWFYFKK